MPDELQKYPTEDIIRILSNLPDFLRESMMKSRLQELCTKDSKAQDEFIDSILDGLSSADNDTLKKVIRTWLVVASKLKGSEVSLYFPHLLAGIKMIHPCTKVTTLLFFLKIINH